MSYRIAHVRFTKSGRTYPVNCHRRDLRKGELVVVELPKERVIKIAEFDSLEFLNWNCANTVLCRQSEFQGHADGTYSINRHEPKGEALETIGDLTDTLRCLGWKIYKPTSTVWRIAFAKAFAEISGLIAVRKNGIDFQAFDLSHVPGISGQEITISVSRKPFVRNWFYASETDLFDLSRDFARELQSQHPSIEPFFVGVGTCHPRPSYEPDDLREIRNAINGGICGSAYLSDDVWI